MLRPKRVLHLLLGILALLAAAHFLFDLALPRLLGPDRGFLGLRRFFRMGEEANLPTYWSALLLLSAGFLLLFIAADGRQANRTYVRHWFFLGLGFIYLSFDEATQIHEGVVAMVWLHFFERGEGLAHYVWYIPAIPVVIVVLLAYVRFLRHLPVRFGALFVTAALLFLGGAFGMDMVEAMLDYNRLQEMVRVSQLFEESMEIGGVTLFVYALLSYLAEARAAILIRPEASLPSSGAQTR